MCAPVSFFIHNMYYLLAILSYTVQYYATFIPSFQLQALQYRSLFIVKVKEPLLKGPSTMEQSSRVVNNANTSLLNHYLGAYVIIIRVLLHNGFTVSSNVQYNKIPPPFNPISPSRSVLHMDTLHYFFIDRRIVVHTSCFIFLLFDRDTDKHAKQIAVHHYFPSLWQ